MTRADRLARHYIRAVGLRALYIAKKGRHVRLGITRDPDGRARALRRERAKVAGVYWFAGGEASAVLAAMVEAFPGIDRGARADLAAVTAALPRLAALVPAIPTDDATVRARAAAVVAEVEERVRTMHANGQLRKFNDAYRAQREAAAERGERFMSYGAYLERYKVGLLYEAARKSGGN